MLTKVYYSTVAMVAVLGSFFTAVEIARHAAGYPGAVLAVPAVIFAFTVSRRPGGEPVPQKVMAAVALSVLAGASVWLGAQMAGHPVIGGAVFVALMAGSIWTRRYGAAVTRLGALVPLALIAALLSAGTSTGHLVWWPICGWMALVGCSAFVWVRVVRLVAERLTGLAGSPPAPAPAKRAAKRAGLSPRDRMALQMAVALSAAFSLGHLMFGQHWQWCVISAMVVSLGPVGRGDLALKGVERGLGAMAGTLVAALIAAVAEPHGTTSIVLIFVVLAVATTLRTYNYAFYAAGITTALSMFYAYFGQSPQHLLLIRLQALVLGAVLAVIVGWFLVPVRTVDAVRARLGAALAALAALLDARRDGASTAKALAAFDAAATNLNASVRSHRLHRRATRKLGVAHGITPADAGEALLAARGPVHALAASVPDPREDATAETVKLLRRAVSAPANPLPELPEPAATAPLADLDAALRRLAAAIPALARRRPVEPAGGGGALQPPVSAA
ncbi:FUSC family protein [Kitasatospora viridis]|uniref:Fusaric acid resistance family protein n=1 Tax=Kitasatospora viridis TaxID=281105 RepID=A0A561SFP0_9ACTN|nr:FUSC family protein [Kitasatospora viridis]TWF73696.1 fusaric acid resistance family protein [Kitasatospora viridis]